jgi:ankyrin repeat protein
LEKIGDYQSQQRAMNIFEVIQVGSIDKLQELVKAGTDVKVPDKSGVTTLMKAAASCSPDGNIVETLIALGVDVNAKDENGKTALMYAAERDSIHVVQVLLAAGADVNAKAEKVAIGWNRTALMYAAWLDHADTVRALIEAGADVNVKNSDGDTALSLAVREDFPVIIEMLRKEAGMSREC